MPCINTESPTPELSSFRAARGHVESPQAAPSTGTLQGLLPRTPLLPPRSPHELHGLLLMGSTDSTCFPTLGHADCTNTQPSGIPSLLHRKYIAPAMWDSHRPSPTTQKREKQLLEPRSHQLDSLELHRGALRVTCTNTYTNLHSCLCTGGSVQAGRERSTCMPTCKVIGARHRQTHGLTDKEL